MDTKNVMVKVRKMVKESGCTQQAIGEMMGYPAKSARQSVSQFLKSQNPTIDVLVRFADAMEVEVEELL